MGQGVTSLQCTTGAEACADKVVDCVNDRDAAFLPPPSLVNQQLLAAAREGDHLLLNIAIQSGANLETRRPIVIMARCDAKDKNALSQVSCDGMTALMYVADSGNRACATLLLDARANIHARDEDGMQPLHFAVSQGSFCVAKLLLGYGADRNSRDFNGKTAIEHLPEDCKRDPEQSWSLLFPELRASQEGEPQQAVPSEAGEHQQAKILAPSSACEGYEQNDSAAA